MESTIKRIATKAGSWYEANAKKLSEELKEYLLIAKEKLEDTLGKKPIKALIVPHAGYFYSGPTAAYSYIHLISDQMAKINNIIVLGPSHKEGFKGCKVSQCNILETPLGDLEVNTELANELLQVKGFSTMSKSVDEDEHSLEMQFPYIYQTVYEYGFKPKILPIMVGQLDSKLSKQIGKILVALLEREDTIFIISSDFCHWGQNFDYRPFSGNGKIYEYIQKMDLEGVEFIEKKDLEGFVNYLDTTQNTICGRNPISLLLATIIQSKLKDKLDIKLTNYAQSNQVTKNSQSSVSYVSMSFYLP